MDSKVDRKIIKSLINRVSMEIFKALKRNLRI